MIAVSPSSATTIPGMASMPICLPSSKVKWFFLHFLHTSFPDLPSGWELTLQAQN